MTEARPEEKVLADMVSVLVDHPESVEIDRTTDDKGVLLTLRVDPQDMGKVIGRAGETAKAMRTIVRAVGGRNEANVSIKIEEPAGSTHIARPSTYRKGYQPMDEVMDSLKN
jgi:uncharacterized protein